MLLDRFDNLSKWQTFASGQAEARISSGRGRRGKGLRFDFDFHGGGGFVVARREMPLEIPESYSFSFGIRGSAPQNIFEFKLVDETNLNVWRYREENFDFSEQWRAMNIAGRQIDFAWGPLGGGGPRNVAAIEFVIAAGKGGSGTIWIDELTFQDETYRAIPVVWASSFLPGCQPDNVFEPDAGLCWQSEVQDEPAWLAIDFQQVREYGGLVIHWVKGHQPRQFDVDLSLDGSSWQTSFATSRGGAERSFLYLPSTSSRHVRLTLLQSAGAKGFGIREIEVKPFDFSRTINDFFQKIAREYRSGLFPKYFQGRQTHWTPIGTGEGEAQALINEEGMVEVDKGSFSIVPFIVAEKALVSWDSVQLEQGLENGCLPIPFVRWSGDTFGLTVTAYVAEAGRVPVLYIRYRVANRTDVRRKTALLTAIMPFQVTPTWQNWRMFGGVSRIDEICCRERTIRVNGSKVVAISMPPNAFGAAAFSEGGVWEFLPKGEVPPNAEVRDEFGYATAAMRFDLEIDPGDAREVYLAVPFGSITSEFERSADHLFRDALPAVQFETAVKQWGLKLKRVGIKVPGQAQHVIDTLRTAAAHILINRDGPALCPGPRRYSRSWIRDGVVMGAALLRLGFTDALRDFIDWYQGHLADDGKIPDCADRYELEWLPEFDAYGEYIYAVMECYRFSGDRDFLVRQWPAVTKAVDYLKGLRSLRLGPEYQTGDKRAFYGLLPESMSHEGYMAHPVHAYWDDFWALRGFQDAALIASLLGREDESRGLADLRDCFEKDLVASLSSVIASANLDYVPGSVELKDFDPAATAIAITQLGQLHLLPASSVESTYERYLAGFRERASATSNWQNYSAYEIRIIGALIRIGRRAEAMELLQFMLADRRIPPWNQWPEISWRDRTGPSFIGDMPHSWISAEYIQAVCSMFAYERGSDDALVLAAGVPFDWLADNFIVAVDDLPTWYGKISYRMWLAGTDSLHFDLQADMAIPPGGIVIQPPLPRPVRYAELNGTESGNSGTYSFTCTECPVKVVLRF